MKRVLFVCVHNSGRSQMAAAFAKEFGRGTVKAESAGTMPSDKVNPVVVEVMKEIGINVSQNKPRLLTREIIEQADLVITMGCSVEEACPAVFVPSEDWDLDDPAGKSIEEVRVIRDQVEGKVRRLLGRLMKMKS